MEADIQTLCLLGLLLSILEDDIVAVNRQLLILQSLAGPLSSSCVKPIAFTQLCCQAHVRCCFDQTIIAGNLLLFRSAPILFHIVEHHAVQGASVQMILLLLLHWRLLLARVKIERIKLLLHRLWVRISCLITGVGTCLHKVTLDFKRNRISLILNTVFTDSAQSRVFEAEELVS